MSNNPAAFGPVEDSEHVITATDVPRGMTPASWDSTFAPDIAGIWKTVDDHGGAVDIATHHVTEGFEDGPGRWEQT